MEKAIAFKAAVASAMAAITMALGWRGILLVVWLACMMLDYLSGSAAAKKNNEWESKVAREGIWHKAGMILVVLVAVLADVVLTMVCQYLPGVGISWPVLLFPVVLAWYIVTELGSVLENAVKMGANVPGWLIKGLKGAKDKLDEAVPTEQTQ